MAESQSRYSIMAELNNRKTNERDKLANLERDKDNHVFDEERKVAQIVEEVVAKEKSYKLDYADRQRQREVNLKMNTDDFNRAKQQLEEGMKDDKDNFEPRFQEWKKSQQDMKALIEKELERYKKIQDKKIADKKAVIEEIEAGIASLKEMSKEQKGE